MRVDGDDKIDTNIIQEMLPKIKESHAVGCISGFRTIDAEGNYIEDIKENMYHPACCLLSRWGVNELKYKEDLLHFEGLEFFKRFRRIYNVDFLPSSLWSYRRHGEQKSSPKNKKERAAIYAKIVG
jgi:hypothetical protein